MIRRFVAWLFKPEAWEYQPEPVVVLASDDHLLERVQRARLGLLWALDVQADQWPEDRNVPLIELTVDVLRDLGVDLVKPEPGEVPVIPGRST
jgi:hypothetical protein